MSPFSSHHTRPAYSLTSTEWKNIKRFGISWGVEQYNLNPKGLAEVCFMKGDAAYKRKDNATGNEFMNMVKELVRKFPDVFTEEPEVIEVSVLIDEPKAEPETEAKDKADAANAAQAEGLDDVARCLLGGADPNAQGQDGTPLHQAATSSKSAAVVQALLEIGADLDARDKNGFTPLHRAAMYSRHPAVIQALLDAGADLNARDNGGFAPLHRAAVGSKTPAVVKLLLDVGADLNARDKNGFTPLYWATQSCKNPVVRELLILNQRGSKPTIAGAEARARAKKNATIKAQVGALILALAVGVALSIGAAIQHKEEVHDAATTPEATERRRGSCHLTQRLWYYPDKEKDIDEQGWRYVEFSNGHKIYLRDNPDPSVKNNREVTRVQEAGKKVLRHLADLDLDIVAADDPRVKKACKKLEGSLQLDYYNETAPDRAKKAMEVKRAMEGVVEVRRLVAQMRKDHRKWMIEMMMTLKAT